MKKEQKYHQHTFFIFWSGLGNYSTTLFHDGIEIHLQGWDPEENSLPFRQLVYKESNQKEKKIRYLLFLEVCKGLFCWVVHYKDFYYIDY